MTVKELEEKVEILEGQIRDLTKIIENLNSNILINDVQVKQLKEEAKKKAIKEFGKPITTSYKLYAGSYFASLWCEFRKEFGCNSCQELLLSDFTDALNFIRDYEDNIVYGGHNHA